MQPDICVICGLSKMDARGYAGTPDLIIEIVSLSTAKKHLDYKYKLYKENGVKEYRIVFPESNALDQYSLSDGRYERKDVYVNGQSFYSIAFPDLLINLEELFYL